MSQSYKKKEESLCEVILATVADDASGIHLRLRDEEKKIHMTFTPKEVWGRISPDKDPKKELQIIADLLNGFKMSEGNHSRERMAGFQPKKIRLIIQ